MVLVYLPTKLGDFVRANVGIHIPYMEHMGIVISTINHSWVWVKIRYPKSMDG